MPNKGIPSFDLEPTFVWSWAGLLLRLCLLPWSLRELLELKTHRVDLLGLLVGPFEVTLWLPFGFGW